MNAVGIDVSKGKSTVAVVRPFGEVVTSPFDVTHTGSELKSLADFIKELRDETSSLSFRSALVTAYKTFPKKSYDFSNDPVEEYAWLAAAREYVSRYPLALNGLPLETIDDVLSIVKEICD